MTNKKTELTKITAEKAGRLYRAKKMSLTLSPRVARDMRDKRGKRKIYVLPNGAYGVMI